MISTKKVVIEKILENLDFGKAKMFYDLGSGNGNVISQIAKRYPNLECIGIEYNVGGSFFGKIQEFFFKK